MRGDAAQVRQQIYHEMPEIFFLPGLQNFLQLEDSQEELKGEENLMKPIMSQKQIIIDSEFVHIIAHFRLEFFCKTLPKTRLIACLHDGLQKVWFFGLFVGGRMNLEFG